MLRDSLGQYNLIITNSSEPTTVSQSLSNLAKGSYVAEVYVQTAGNRKATLKVTSSTNTKENYTTSSLWENYILADSKHGSKMQKMFVYFDVEKYHDDIKLELNTSSGDSIVVYDDVRVTRANKKSRVDSIYFQENFEHIPSGIIPFVKGEAGGANDPRVHLAEKHSPYTQKGWDGKKVSDVLNGNWSLKLHEDAQGIIIQTIPQNLRFAPNQKYKITFNYQAESDHYSFVLGDNTTILFENKIGQQNDTQLFEFVFTASSSGNSWFGIKKNGEKVSDFILDDLKIIEMK